MATIKHPTIKSAGQKLYAVADWNANHTAVISHTELTDKGVKTHPQIDTHIDDSSIHEESETLVHKTGNEEIAGVKTFTSFSVTPSSSPSADYQVANKFYVDAIAVGLTWKAPVATYDDLATTYPDPEVGWAVLVLDETRGYTWDGASWVQFTAYQEYTASNGVQKVVNDFQVDLADTNPNIEVADGGIRIKVDDSTIERTASGIAVKDLGITNNKLAGSITDGKLNKIETAGKVSGSALTELNLIPSGASQVPVANLGTGTPTEEKFLAGDGSWKEIDVGVGFGVTAYYDIDIVSSPQTAQTWSNMPLAVTELFANTNSRIKANLSLADQFRIIVNQSVAGASGAKFKLQYSTDNVTYQDAFTGVAGVLDVGLGTGVKVSTWGDLVAGAKADVYLRITGYSGNGVADPAWRQIRLQFRLPAEAGVTAHDIDGASHTGTLSWSKVSKTGSNLNEIATRSHTVLSDIGTNTHSDIDTHISDTVKHSVEHGIIFIIDGGGAEITTGDKGDIEIPFNCTINSATLLADRNGDIQIDIWVNGYADYPPTNGDTITNGNEPAIVSGDKYQDNTLTDWTTTLTKGDVMRVNVDSCATIQRCTLSLKINKT